MTPENMRKIVENGIKRGWLKLPEPKRPTRYSIQKERQAAVAKLMGWDDSANKSEA